MYFEHSKPSAHSYGEQHKADFLCRWINGTVTSRYTSKMSKATYHTSSHQMTTPSASSAVSHRPSRGRTQAKRTKKAVSTRLSVYSSQSLIAHTSQAIDINVITTSSNNGREAMAELSVDGENLDIDLEKELGM